MFSLPLVWCAVRARPGKTAFSILGIALGIATAVAILTIDESTVLNKILAKTEQFARVDLEVTPADPNVGPVDALELLQRLPSVAQVAAIAQTSGVLSIDGRYAGGARVVGLDAVARNSGAFDAYRILAGRDLPLVDNREDAPQCLLGAELAQSLALYPGDRIAVGEVRIEREDTLCVNGELVKSQRGPTDDRVQSPPVEFEIAGTLDRYHLGKQSGGSLVVIPLAWFEKVFPNARGSTVYWISKKAKFTAEQLKSSLTPVFAYSAERTALIGEAADERAFRNGVRVSGVLALLLGLFVIFHTLAMSLVERVREIAILNALGSTRGQIGRAFFLEGLLVAASGAAIGIGLGIGLAKLALRAGYTTLGKVGGVDLLQVSWNPILAIAGTGVAVALVGSIFPLVKARAIYPARVLAQRDLGTPTDFFRGMNFLMFGILAIVLPILYFFVVPVLGEGSRETGRVLVLGGTLFVVFLGFLLLAPKALAWICGHLTRPFERIWPLAGFLSGRSMAEGIPRVATSAAVIALVGAALIAIKAITASLQFEVRSWGRTVESKVFVTPAQPLPRERAESLLTIPGVAGLESLEYSIRSPFLVRGMRAKEAGMSGALADNEVARRFEETESLVVSTPLARALRLRVGSEVPIGVPSGPPRRFLVAAIDDELGYFPPEREYAVMSETWLKKYFCLSSEEWVGKFALRMVKGTDPAVMAKAIATALADLPPPKIRTGVYVRDFEIEDIDRDFRLFDLILTLVAALAGVGVLNALLIAAYERRKEIGVLKAIGMTRNQLAGTVLVEAATTGILGGAFGVVLGIAFAGIAVDTLSRLTGLPLSVVVEPHWWIVAFAGGIVLALLASIFPILRSNQFSPAEAVRYE